MNQPILELIKTAFDFIFLQEVEIFPPYAGKDITKNLSVFSDE